MPDNASNGLDHGAASFVMLAGAPVTSGLYGTYPNLGSLDNDDNLNATVDLWDYYATLSQAWLGVAAVDVLGAGATPIPGIVQGVLTIGFLRTSTRVAASTSRLE